MANPKQKRKRIVTNESTILMYTTRESKRLQKKTIKDDGPIENGPKQD
jgi:hypothetical protein